MPTMSATFVANSGSVLTHQRRRRWRLIRSRRRMAQTRLVDTPKSAATCWTDPVRSTIPCANITCALVSFAIRLEVGDPSWRVPATPVPSSKRRNLGVHTCGNLGLCAAFGDVGACADVLAFDEMLLLEQC